MTFRLEILPEAEADIASAVRWYGEPETGLDARFIREVAATIRSLERNALLYQVRHRPSQVRWVVSRSFPYRIAYRIKVERVQVFAVVHCARHEREFWRRLPPAS